MPIPTRVTANKFKVLYKTMKGNPDRVGTTYCMDKIHFWKISK